MVRKKHRAAVATLIMILISEGYVIEAQQVAHSQEQQEPSLSETERWIGQTFMDGSHIVYKAFQHIEFNNASNAPCLMSFTVNEQVGQALRYWDLVDLADIDPTSIKVSALIHDTDITTVKDPRQVDYSNWAVKDHPYVFVSLKTTNDVNTVISHTQFAENDKPTSVPPKTLTVHEHEVGFPHEGIAVEPDYASHFVNALRHAVNLCGGKPSAF